MQITYTVLHIADWSQTRYTAKNPDHYHENNPILGKHPSVGRVNTYFAATLIGHTLISYALPSKYRVYWQSVTIGLEGTMVARNYRIGIKFDF